jgi:hypothetical protein
MRGDKPSAQIGAQILVIALAVQVFIAGNLDSQDEIDQNQSWLVR